MSNQTSEKIFHPTAEKLKFLLASIDNREMALPDFQRDFVWDPSATEELIESICQSFPAGSLLRIKNADDAFFTPREIAEAPKLNGHAPSYLILDGQQRLTSLYQAFYGVGSHRFFIELAGLIEGKDLEDCVRHERAKVFERRFGKPEQQAEKLLFPFSMLFGKDSGFDEWMDAILDLRPEAAEQKRELKAKIRRMRAACIQPVIDYEFPMVTLADTTTPEAVCTIFETLNRTGVRLSVFDLLAARFWPQDVRLRDQWLKALEELPIIGEFETDPYYVLQAIALFAAKGAPSCKRSDVLRLTVEQIRAGWEPVIEALAEAYRMLRDDCGVILPQWMPYVTLVVSLAATFARANSASGPAVGANREKIKRWFWCSVFGQAYENAPNSQSAKDFIEVGKWLAGGEEPQSVAGFSFDPKTLRQTTPRQRAVYRGSIALILRNEARDFHSGKRITANMIQADGIDDHHIFPQGYIVDHLLTVTATNRDCILNRTLIDRKTNMSIGKRAPREYLREVKEALGDKFAGMMASHLLPADEGSALISGDFEGFLDYRERTLMEKINEVTR